MTMNLTVCALSLFVVASLEAAEPPPEVLSFDPPRGVIIEAVFEQRLATSVELEVSMTIDGKLQDDWDVGQTPMASVMRQSITVRDAYLAVSAGAGPQRSVNREFRALRRSRELTAQAESRRALSSSDLEGEQVLFGFDEQAQSYRPIPANPDLKLADFSLEEDMSLRGFLPPGPVEVGDEWPIGILALERVLQPGGDLALVESSWAEVPGEQRKDDDLAALRRGVLGEVLGTYVGTHEEGGRTLAEIRIEARISGTRVWPKFEGPPSEGPEGLRARMTATLEGTLEWDLERGHASSLHLSGPATTHLVTSSSMSQSGEPLSYEMSATRQSTLQLDVKLTELQE